jgi:uncharacterized protein YbaP (TraB family)
MRIGAALVAGALLALAACGRAQHAWPPPSPALWEVSGPAGRQAWLFGTVHALPKGMNWRTGKVDDALARSSVLVVEIADLNDTEAARSAFYRLSSTPRQPPLTQRVPPAARTAVLALLKRAGVGDESFPETETWGAAMILANRVSRADPANGVDGALIAGARRVEGLETFAEQYGVFDRLPQPEQADLLVATARDAATDVEDREAIAWLTGDIATLERAAASGVLADPELREALQLARNRAWDKRIERLLANGEKPFVAVGAAHMFGQEGLPALLAAHGYEVRRVE